MFWKKQPHDTKMIFYNENQELRNAFRYKPRKTSAPKIVFLGKTVELLDISASGTSFKAEGFIVGDNDKVQLDLNNSHAAKRHKNKKIPLLELKIKIISVNNRTGVCHCCFEDINEEQKDIIHQYILNEQKIAIRESKKRDTSH